MKPTKYFKFVLFGDLNDLQFQFIEITNSRIEQLPNILNM